MGSDVQNRVPVGFPLTRGHAAIGVHESRMMLRIAYIPQMMGRILHDFMCSYQHSKNWWIIWSCVVLCIDAGTTLHRRFSNQSLYVILIIFISEALNPKTPGFPAPSFFNGRPLLHQLLYALNLALIVSRPSQSPRFRVGVLGCLSQKCLDKLMLVQESTWGFNQRPHLLEIITLYC